MPRNRKDAPPPRLTDSNSPQTLFPASALVPERLSDGRACLTVHIPGKVLMFPMQDDYADELGRKLSGLKLILPAGATTEQTVADAT